MDKHVQCYLEKLDGPKTLIQVAWIPEDIASIGNIVDLKDATSGEWTREWKVIKRSNQALYSSWVAERTQDHKNMRRMTDI